MRETVKARQAWNDYLQMGSGRSLEKLLVSYQERARQAVHEPSMLPPTLRWPSLSLWSRTFHWQQRLADIAEQERQAIIKQGIANKQFRVDTLNDLHNKMLRVIDARAEENAELTGGDTGLIVREVTYLPGGGERVKHEVDTGLLAEMRATAKQAAQELGQWVEKVAPTDPSGKKEYAGLSDEERSARIAQLLDRARARRVGQSTPG